MNVFFKKRGSQDLKDFRPINCVKTTYKIVSKIMANRLLEVVQHLVAPNQTPIIKGRYMCDNFSLASEMVAGFRRSSTAPRACLKVDFAKAYDLVSWVSLEFF